MSEFNPQHPHGEEENQVPQLVFWHSLYSLGEMSFWEALLDPMPILHKPQSLVASHSRVPIMIQLKDALELFRMMI